MAKSDYSNNLYQMYEEEFEKNSKLEKELRYSRLEKNNLQTEFNLLKKNYERDIEKKVEAAVKPKIEEIKILEEKYEEALQEIARLKVQLNESPETIEEKNYKIDKLTSQVNKNSTNSSIPTSKEIKPRPTQTKTGANLYNHREKSGKPNGGQIGHKGNTLTVEDLEKDIKEKNIKVIEVIHYINGNPNEQPIVKYKKGLKVIPYVEKHIFIKSPNSIEKLPESFYSNVTYHDDIKAVVTILGNYYSLGYNKAKELLYDFSNGFIDISEGTIDNIYEEFSDKTEETINNIVTNLKNGTFQHTDETSSKENGKEMYFRGYANPTNVVYKPHYNKGDTPIKEDGIITNYYGTIISDHETGIFKYGTNNQDCVVHIGRYCKEQNQNIPICDWQINLYHLLLRYEIYRQIRLKFGVKSFSKKEIKLMEKAYFDILEIAKEQNKMISSTFWREKANTLLNRLIKYASSVLFYLYDFSISFDNNFMERALRMIKGKTKVSGGFRSMKGAIRFANTMSIIKTAKLRGLNPFKCITDIYQGKALFA